MAAATIDILAAAMPFARLDRDALRLMAEKAQLLRPGGSNDEFLFRVGDATEGLYLIVPGRDGSSAGPAVQVSFDDRQALAPRVGYRLVEGEIAGDLEFLAGGLGASPPRRIASARALRPLQVVHVPASQIAEAARANAEFRALLVSGAARRMVGLLSEKAAETAVHPEVRFAEGLLALLEDYGHVVANRGVFATKLTQQEVADRLGMSRRLLSLRCSDWSARGLVETSPFCLPDYRRIDRIASFGQEPVRTCLPAAIEEVEAHVARGMPALAGLAATDALVVFPGNPVLSHLLALASARMGARERAERIMSVPALAWDGSIGEVKSRLREAWARSLQTRHSGAAGLEEEDEETLRAFLEARLPMLAIDIGALHARLRKDHIEEAPDNAGARRAARDAAMLYWQVHEARPNHYCAVNAATLFLVAGETDPATALAEEAIRLAGAEEPNYWAAASHGEALVVLGRAEEAGAAFAGAAALPDCDLAKTVSTRRQLNLLRLRAGVEAGASLDVLDPGAPLFFSGPLMTPADGDLDALRKAEAAIAAAIASWLAGERVPVAFSSAACGADILFAEAAIRARVPLHLILPFSIDRFTALSVRIAEGWEQRFLSCLDRADSVTELWQQEVPKSAVDHHFLRANRHMAGETIRAAHVLQTKPRMLAVRDDRANGSRAGTGRIADAFAALGHSVSVIPSPFRRPEVRPGAPSPSPFAPVVFAFARAQSDGDAFAGLLSRLGFAIRTMKDRRQAGQRICADWEEAIAVASLACRQASADEAPVRVVCDYGPVRRRDGGTDDEAVLRLEAAFDLTAAAFGDVHATSAFVMAELASGGRPEAYTAINVSMEQEPGDRLVVRGARQIYGLASTRAS